MISYRDMTFCTEDTCAKWEGCHRALTEDVLEAATVWWGSDDAPISMWGSRPGCYEASPMYDNMRDVLVDEELEGC